MELQLLSIIHRLIDLSEAESDDTEQSGMEGLAVSDMELQAVDGFRAEMSDRVTELERRCDEQAAELARAQADIAYIRLCILEAVKNLSLPGGDK